MRTNNLVNEGYDAFLHRLYPEVKSKTAINITFQVTDACNLCCSYCYQINKGTHRMPFDIAKKFIDLLLDNDERILSYVDTNEYQAVILDFIGGEPFLEVELIDQIIDYFIEQTIIRNHHWQYYYMVSISTNGTLYFKPEVQDFIKKHKNHLSLGITVDGHKELHDACRLFPDGTGSYDLAMAAVKDYSSTYNRTMPSKVTLAPANINQAASALIHLIEQGYEAINCNCVFEKGWTLEHATILYYELKKVADYLLENNKCYELSILNPANFHPKSLDDIDNWCGGNGRMLAVDYKGDIYPCVRYMESSLGDKVPPVIAGNVYDGLMQNVECKNCIEALKKVNRINQSTEECINCSIAAGCAWCQAYNYQDSGDFNHRATYICVMHQAAALANSYYWNRYYLQNQCSERIKLWLEDDKALKIIPKEELALLKLLQYPLL